MDLPLSPSSLLVHIFSFSVCHTRIATLPREGNQYRDFRIERFNQSINKIREQKLRKNPNDPFQNLINARSSGASFQTARLGQKKGKWEVVALPCGTPVLSILIGWDQWCSFGGNPYGESPEVKKQGKFSFENKLFAPEEKEVWPVCSQSSALWFGLTASICRPFAVAVVIFIV